MFRQSIRYRFADVKVEPDVADFKPDADTERIEVEAEFQFFENFGAVSFVTFVYLVVNASAYAES